MAFTKAKLLLHLKIKVTVPGVSGAALHFNFVKPKEGRLGTDMEREGTSEELNMQKKKHEPGSRWGEELELVDSLRPRWQGLWRGVESREENRKVYTACEVSKDFKIYPVLTGKCLK